MVSFLPCASNVAASPWKAITKYFFAEKEFDGKKHEEERKINSSKKMREKFSLKTLK